MGGGRFGGAAVPAGRAWAGPDDLARLEAAVTRSWLVGRPLVNLTTGDLEWWLTLGAPDTDWSRRVRLWPDPDDDGSVLAFAWFTPPGELDWHQRADLPRAARAALVDEALAWATATALEEARVPGTEPPSSLRAWALDADAELGTLLRDRGFAPADAPGYVGWYRRLDDARPLRAPEVPAGYHVRHVRLPDDLEPRVAVHRSAFAPSRMSVEKYRVLTSMPSYDPARDLVVEAPDGSLAACTMAWLDPVARVGLFEPVGTHADHRRLGLALAVCRAGLRLLRDLGAVDCVVLSAATNAASNALYAAAGFEVLTEHRPWTIPLAVAAPDRAGPARGG